MGTLDRDPSSTPGAEVLADTATRKKPVRPTLRAGDTIQYYSPAFIAGDPIAKPTATIVRIAQYEDPKYPIEVNRIEVLLLWTRLTRTIDAGGKPCLPQWFQLKWYNLVDGMVEVEPQERAFNHGVAEALASSGVVQKSTSKNMSDALVAYSSDGVFNQKASSEVVSSENSAGARAATVENISKFENLLTAAQRREKQHRPKNRLGLKQRSKQKHHQKLRTPGRDSKTVTHSRSGASQFLKKFMQQPDVQLALCIELQTEVKQTTRNERKTPKFIAPILS